MKKEYKKPDVSFELFSFTQNVALNCGVPHEGNILGRHQFASPDNCAWFDGDELYIWFESNGVCTLDESNATWLCYNNPTESTAVFGS